MRKFLSEHWLSMFLVTFALIVLIVTITKKPRQNPFSGYVVAKEHRRPGAFMLHVANKEEVKAIPVDSLTYTRTELLEQFTYY
jgi:hypothetical protein